MNVSRICTLIFVEFYQFHVTIPTKPPFSTFSDIPKYSTFFENRSPEKDSIINVGGTSKLPNWEDVIIKNVKNKSDKLFIQIELPEAVSVDEFKGNAGAEKYNCIFVDPQNKKVLDILPDRYENHLIQYFSQFDSKKNVKYFICVMNPHFRNIAKACFPQAKIVADKFHVVQQVSRAMEWVRKNEQSKLPDMHRKYFKRSRYLLVKPIEN